MKTVLWKDTLSQVVRQWGVMQPQKIAVGVGKKATTYKELNRMVESCCLALKARGIKQGDCILLSAVMRAEYIAAFLAVKQMRMIAVPVDRAVAETMVEDLIKRTGAKVFLTDNSRYKNIVQCLSLEACCHGEGVSEHVFQGEWEEIPGEEVTEILFTSGTTGRPKGVMLTQSGVCASIFNTSTGMDMQKCDVLLLPVPLHHSFGLRVLRSALYQGETIILQNGFSFAREIEQSISYWNCNCMAAVNAGFEKLLHQMGEKYIESFSKMRYIEFGAGAVPLKRRKQLIQDLPNVRLYNVWGSTETGSGLFLEFSDAIDKLQSAGKAINEIEAAIVDENGNRIPAGQYGRLAIKSPALLKGYYHDPKLDAQALHGEWFYTNDLAKLDAEGYVYLNGRVDDLINVGGEKVAPIDVERIISTQNGVKECACCGVEDPNGILGEVPVVFIVEDEEGFDEKEIVKQIRTLGNSYMVPSAFIKLSELPRNFIGKIDRKKMKEMWKETLNKSFLERDFQDSGYNHDDFAKKVLNLILTRRSVRSFKEKKVPKQFLDQLVLAGRMAPSGHNLQTWRFTVLQTQERILTLRETIRRVAEEKKTSFYGFQNPQAVILVSNDKRNKNGVQDSAAAIENILLMAHAMSLGACWINAMYDICEEREIRKLLIEYDIPKTHVVYGLIGLGYPENVPKALARKEKVVKYIQ